MRFKRRNLIYFQNYFIKSNELGYKVTNVKVSNTKNFNYFSL